MSALNEVTVGEHTYRLRRLDPMRQFHIVRRVAPLLTSFGGGLDIKVDAEGQPVLPKGDDADPFKSFGPLAEALAKMPDTDAEYVINTCLTVVDRKAKNGFVPIIQGGANMFSAELDLPIMLQLVWEVGKANLSGFTDTFQSLKGSAKGAEA